jgi:hypothetical protein
MAEKFGILAPSLGKPTIIRVNGRAKNWIGFVNMEKSSFS